MITISVVIPTYNYSSTLSRAVNSVLRQSDDHNVELLVIDDGSTDNTPEVIEQLKQEFPDRFNAIRKANGGPASARNLGIEKTSGQYLIFLDADDELCEDALQKIHEYIERYPQTRLIIGEHIAISADGKQKEHKVKALPSSPLERVKGYLLDKTVALSNGACILHRDIFTMGVYPEQFRNAEDIPVFAQALANYPSDILPYPIVRIHKHDDSLRHQFNFSKQGGADLVDEVFSPDRLGLEFQGLKKKFFVQRHLSLFRSAYIAGDTESAKKYFMAALKQDWKVVFMTSYMRKALRLWLKTSS